MKKDTGAEKGEVSWIGWPEAAGPNEMIQIERTLMTESTDGEAIVREALNFQDINRAR